MTSVRVAAVRGGLVATVALVSACGGGGDEAPPLEGKQQLRQDVVTAAMSQAKQTHS